MQMEWQTVCSELENSGIRVVIAVPLNVGSGVYLIKSAKMFMCMQKHYKCNADRCTALCVRRSLLSQNYHKYVDQYCVIQLSNGVFSIPKYFKDLDLSYKTDLDHLNCFG